MLYKVYKYLKKKIKFAQVPTLENQIISLYRGKGVFLWTSYQTIQNKIVTVL